MVDEAHRAIQRDGFVKIPSVLKSEDAATLEQCTRNCLVNTLHHGMSIESLLPAEIGKLVC